MMQHRVRAQGRAAPRGSLSWHAPKSRLPQRRKAPSPWGPARRHSRTETRPGRCPYLLAPQVGAVWGCPHNAPSAHPAEMRGLARVGLSPTSLFTRLPASCGAFVGVPRVRAGWGARRCRREEGDGQKESGEGEKEKKQQFSFHFRTSAEPLTIVEWPAARQCSAR